MPTALTTLPSLDQFSVRPNFFQKESLRAALRKVLLIPENDTLYPLKKPVVTVVTVVTEVLFSVLRVVATGRDLLPRLQSTYFLLLQVLIWMKGIRSQYETSRCRSEAAAGLVAATWTLKTRSPGTATSTGLMTSGPRSPTLLSSDRFAL